MKRQVLLIEDDDALRASLAQTLELAGMVSIPTASFMQARRSVRSNFSGVILSDIRMPQQDGFDVLEAVGRIDSELPVVLMTGHSDVPTAMRAMKQGAYDYLEKPCSTDRLIEVLNRALDHRALVLKSRQIERTLLRSDSAAQNFPGSSVTSEAFRTALRQLAGTRSHVHLFGDPGVGKKLAAFTINHLAEEPCSLLQVNLQNAPAGILGDLKVPDGRCDLSLKRLDHATPQQGRNLVSLMQKHPHLRLISSASRPVSELGAAVFPDDFDVFEQFIELRIPTIAERREDLPEIFELILRQVVRVLDADMPDIPEALIAEIMRREWPGNLPELRSFATSFALGQKAHAVEGEHQTLAHQIDAFEKLVLIETLRRSNGRATEAARSLGLPRNTLYDRLARYDLSAKDFRADPTD